MGNAVDAYRTMHPLGGEFTTPTGILLCLIIDEIEM